MTAVSCIVRGMAEEPMGRFDNFTSARTLHDALARERCEVVCTGMCQTVCTTEHLSVHARVTHMVHSHTAHLPLGALL